MTLHFFSDPCSDPDVCGPNAFCRRLTDDEIECCCKPNHYEANPGDAATSTGCVSKYIFLRANEDKKYTAVFRDKF